MLTSHCLESKTKKLEYFPVSCQLQVNCQYLGIFCCSPCPIIQRISAPKCFTRSSLINHMSTSECTGSFNVDSLKHSLRTLHVFLDHRAAFLLRKRQGNDQGSCFELTVLDPRIVRKRDGTCPLLGWKAKPCGRGKTVCKLEHFRL